MNRMQAATFLSALGVLGMLTSATNGAEPVTESTPSVTATVKEYALELRTLNLGDKVRRRQVEFDIADAMTEDELQSVKDILDQLRRG
jgi:hypothetical protein